MSLPVRAVFDLVHSSQHEQLIDRPVLYLDEDYHISNLVRDFNA